MGSHRLRSRERPVRLEASSNEGWSRSARPRPQVQLSRSARRGQAGAKEVERGCLAVRRRMGGERDGDRRGRLSDDCAMGDRRDARSSSLDARQESPTFGSRPADEWNDLIKRVAENRDQAAFSALFLHFAPRLKSYLLQRGLDGPRSEEFAQETLLAVWMKASLFEPGKSAAATWIFTIARNLLVDARRKDIRAHKGAAVLDEDLDAPEQPDGRLEAGERDHHVSSAMGALSPEQRQVVSMSYFHDLPHAQISETLGVPLGTVKSRLRLAAQRLRTLLRVVR
jgi:RNA polymerase sigma-70 factor, ECF subfamily